MSTNFFESDTELKFSKKARMSKVPWVEKYRPKKLNDIVFQDEIKEILKSALITKNIPHMLLYGSSGTGKTSTILAFCYELYGPDIFNDRVLELNASDERGINTVRTKITNFARKTMCNPDPKYPSPPFKIIILDEADAITNEAQSALRKIIETYSSTTRFCFICNYINQIIDPIVSRCIKFRFKPVKNIIDKLRYICHNENLIISDKILNKIINISYGDMRKSIMILQNLKYIYEFNNNTLSLKDIGDITGRISKKPVIKLIDICFDNKKSLSDIIFNVDNIIKKGYSIVSVIELVNLNILKNDTISDKIKSDILFTLSNVEKKINDGAGEYIQLLFLFSYIMNCFKYPKNKIILDLCL